MDAVIPAAGRGTRLRPLTENTPKALVEIADRPLLAHVFDALSPANPDSYVVVIGYRGDQIAERFGTSYGDIAIEYVRQETQSGLADAVSQVEPVVDDDILVCNGDNVLSEPLDQLAAAHTGAGTLLVETVDRERAKTTGVVETATDGRVRRVIEKPDEPPRALASAGAYAFSPVIFEACREIEPASTGEYELADAINWLVERGETVRTHRYSGTRVNLNTIADRETAEQIVSTVRYHE